MIILKKRFLYFIPGILWLTISFILLTLPGKQIPKVSWMDFYQADKLVHIIMFFLLGFFFSYAIKDSFKKYTLLIWIAVAGLVYGIAMEFVQKYFIPFRSCDVDDMLADGIGSLLAYIWWRRKFKKADIGYL
jgi:hypothetical protein